MIPPEQTMDEGYKAMAADPMREAEASEWTTALSPQESDRSQPVVSPAEP